MEDQLQRTRMLLGEKGVERLLRARVAVFGLGGVGSYVAEALARSGVGTLDLIDDDRIALTNLNRLLYATHDNIGQLKTEVMRDRICAIRPETIVNIYSFSYLPETTEKFDFSRYDFVADAIDTVAGKIQLCVAAHEANVPIICAMGAGNKLDPTAFQVADLSKTSVDPLARVMRRELKKRGIEHVRVVYSKEPPITPEPCETEDGTLSDNHKKRQTPGSCAFVPSVVGLIMAGEIVRTLSGIQPAYDSSIGGE